MKGHSKATWLLLALEWEVEEVYNNFSLPSPSGPQAQFFLWVRCIPGRVTVRGKNITNIGQGMTIASFSPTHHKHCGSPSNPPNHSTISALPRMRVL
jgi:hypothetical protein